MMEQGPDADRPRRAGEPADGTRSTVDPDPAGIGGERARTARIALACLDLTSLNDADTPADIHALCARARGPCGPVAAVCVWPRFAALARSLLPPSIAVAAVANFPDGGSDLQRALRDTGEIVDAGAQEVDVVMPYRDLAAAPALLAAVRRACAGQRLKVILETGELPDDAAIAMASRIALDAGADFLKTSTGKTARSASPEAARAMLETIARTRDAGIADGAAITTTTTPTTTPADVHPITKGAAGAPAPAAAGPGPRAPTSIPSRMSLTSLSPPTSSATAALHAGFKASGGIRTVADAAVYIALVAQWLGPDAVAPARFRIGASGLLNDIEAVLSGRRTGGTGAAY